MDKMHRHFLSIIVLVLAALLLLPLSSYARTGPPGHRGATGSYAFGVDFPMPLGGVFDLTVSHQNYYVDATNGNDSYDGKAGSYDGTHGPWKTLQKVYDMSSPSAFPQPIQAGDKILLKRGETWNDPISLPNGVKTALAIQCGGTVISPNIINYITIGDYGSTYLPKPVINGDDIAVNNGDCAIYLDRDFIYLKNIFITYINNGYKDINGNVTGYTIGKGIRIDPNITNPDSTGEHRNIVVESCDVSNCPQDGIAIGDRGHIVISGYRSAIISIICFLLILSDVSADSPQGEMVIGPPGASRSRHHLPSPPRGSSSGSSSIIPPGISTKPPNPPGISTNESIGPVSKSASSIFGNGWNGISVFGNSTKTTSNIKINNCYIHDNNWNGIYLAGDNARIQSNIIEKNGRTPPQNPPDHNIYLWGDGGTVIGNTLQNANNGDGFRYSGSNLQFNNNIVKDNHRLGIGLGSDDPISNCSNNTISYNTIKVKRFSDIVYNNMAISIGYEPDKSLFSHTNILYNNIKGQNEAHAGGIDLQPCLYPIIQHNKFTSLSGPEIQIDRSGWNWSWPTWTSDLNLTSDFSDWNTFYYTDPNNLWFDDGLGCYSWDCWHSKYDLHSTVVQGEYDPNSTMAPGGW